MHKIPDSAFNTEPLLHLIQLYRPQAIWTGSDAWDRRCASPPKPWKHVIGRFKYIVARNAPQSKIVAELNVILVTRICGN